MDKGRLGEGGLSYVCDPGTAPGGCWGNRVRGWGVLLPHYGPVACGLNCTANSLLNWLVCAICACASLHWVAWHLLGTCVTACHPILCMCIS